MKSVLLNIKLTESTGYADTEWDVDDEYGTDVWNEESDEDDEYENIVPAATYEVNKFNLTTVFYCLQ